MDPTAILADVGYVLTLGKMALSTAEDVAPFLEQAYQLVVTGTGLTADQRSTLVDQETAMRALLDAPTQTNDQA